jgi:hypothetical protein
MRQALWKLSASDAALYLLVYRALGKGKKRRLGDVLNGFSLIKAERLPISSYGATKINLGAKK